MPPARAPLPLRQAIALGLIQGPTELLPVSSSAHISLIPWLCGWSYQALEAERRKGFAYQKFVSFEIGAGTLRPGRISTALSTCSDPSWPLIAGSQK